MSSQKQDLRVIRTHKMIKNALIELLKTKAFDDIAVQDIIELAMVNRATFYKYYSGKSDLAGALISEFKTHYGELLKSRLETDDFNDWLNIAMPFLFENRTLILALWKIKNKRHHLYDDMFLMIQENYIKHASQFYPNTDLTFQGYLLAHLILNGMRFYFEQDLPVNPKKVQNEFEAIVKMMTI